VALIPLNPPAPDTFARQESWDASAVLKYWHLTSLDAPTVAVAWAAAFAWAAHIRAACWQLLILFLLVWSFYVADRLLDVRRGRDLLQDRHYFHWRHRRVLVPLAAAAAGVSAWLICSRISVPNLERDSAVGLATLAYFSGVHSRRRTAPWLIRAAARIGSREALVGIIFSAGCVLPAAANASALAVLIAVATPAMGFAVLAWLNVRAIGRWEDPHTAARMCVSRIGLALAAAAAGLGCALILIQPRSAVLLFSVGASALLIAGLEWRRDCISGIGLRAAADVVLLTPLVFIPLAMAVR